MPRRRMSNTTLIAVLIAVTAIVALVTRFIELILAWRKYQAERPKPQSSNTTSPASQQTRARRIPWLSMCLFILAPLYLILGMFAPDHPATLKEVATLCLCVAMYVIADRNLGPSQL